jgi:AAA family ATP:ADP antiporter
MAVLWSFLYFFACLSSYYILRPIRDEFGVSAGVQKLPLLFTATFIVTLLVTPIFGAIVARVPRRRIVPVSYHLFSLMLVGFFAALHLGVARGTVGIVFFVWVSVYNLFVTSVFWSLMADLFTVEQGRRLFGLIAAGGTLGAMAGPSVTSLLVGEIGTKGLFLVSIGLLQLSVVCVLFLVAWARKHGNSELARTGERSIGGSLVDGAKVTFRSSFLRGTSLQIVLLTTTQTVLYFAQASLVKGAIADEAERTQLLANVDLVVNLATLLLQGVLFSRLVRWLGVGVALAATPVVAILVLGASAALPVLAVVLTAIAARRAAHYALERPARELLFTAVGADEKYKAKNFQDTGVYRGGDVAAAWMLHGLGLAGLGIAGTAIVGLPFAIAGVGVALWLGRRHRELAQQRGDET